MKPQLDMKTIARALGAERREGIRYEANV